MDNLNTFGKRLKAETPVFWKKIRNGMISCLAVGLGLAALPTAYTEWMPDNICGILITIGTVGTILAQSTVKGK